MPSIAKSIYNRLHSKYHSIFCSILPTLSHRSNKIFCNVNVFFVCLFFSVQQSPSLCSSFWFVVAPIDPIVTVCVVVGLSVCVPIYVFLFLPDRRGAHHVVLEVIEGVTVTVTVHFIYVTFVPTTISFDVALSILLSQICSFPTILQALSLSLSLSHTHTHTHTHTYIYIYTGLGTT